MPTRAERIVVGYDGSPSAERAVTWAATEAVRRGSELTVVHAVHPAEYLFGPRGTWQLVSDRMVEAAGAVTGDGVDRARGAAPSVEVSGVTARGLPAATLVDASKRAALLVVGTRGHGELIGTLAGSVAFPVTAHAQCPVVVVHATDTQEPPGPGHPVVVGVDGSDRAETALRWATDVAASSGASLVVATAWWSSVKDPWYGVMQLDRHHAVELDRSVREDAERTAAAAAELARRLAPGLVVGTQVAAGPPAHVLKETGGQAGLLVVGSRGHGGFAGLLLGSVSHQLIHTAPCPVAVVRQT